MTALALRLPDDHDLLAFIFARFIDGELTGIAEGRAMQFAPDLSAADFLARQIRDEIRHARLYAGLYAYVSPEAPVPRQSWLLKVITAPVSGRLWIEHCFLDKAVGERWVHFLMQALTEHLEDARIVKTLKAIARDELTHIAFGEAQVRLHAGQSRFRRYYLWGLYLRVDFALGLAYRMTRRLIARRYSLQGAQVLELFFTRYREQGLAEIADLLGVKPVKSIGQMFACQVLYLFRWLFTGWLRNPARAFRRSAEN